MLFNWKDLLDCLELLLVHIVGLRQVLLHDFVIYLLVHNDNGAYGASLTCPLIFVVESIDLVLLAHI